MPLNDNQSSLPIERIIDWLRRQWILVAAFIGAVVVIVQFVELWKGNKGLVTWAAMILGYLALLSIIGYIAFAKIISPIDQSRKIPAYPSKVKFAKPAFFIVMLVPIGALGVLLAKPTSTIMPDPGIETSVSTSTSNCQGAEVYLELNLLGRLQEKCPLEHNKFVISVDEVGGLPYLLTGRVVDSTGEVDSVCNWEWSINNYITRNELDENCNFSIDLRNTATEILIRKLNTEKPILLTIEIRP
jgi:hypothetical protein